MKLLYNILKINIKFWVNRSVHFIIHEIEALISQFVKQSRGESALMAGVQASCCAATLLYSSIRRRWSSGGTAL